MDVVVIRSSEQLDASLRQELPELIKAAWRKVYVNMGAYTEAYEQDGQIWGLGMIEGELVKGSRWFAERFGKRYARVFLRRAIQKTCLI